MALYGRTSQHNMANPNIKAIIMRDRYFGYIGPVLGSGHYLRQGGGGGIPKNRSH